jgi:hypothetical protein
LDFGAQNGDGWDTDRRLAEQQLTSAGFSVSSVGLDFIGCSGGEGQGQVSGIALSLGSSGSTGKKCDKLPLPLMESQTVTCHGFVEASADSQQGDADATWAPSCSITFHPAAK